MPTGHGEVTASMSNEYEAQAPKARIFRASLRNFWLLAGIAAPFLAALASIGSFGLKVFPVEARDPFRFVTGYLPLLLAATCALGLVFIYFKNARRRIGTSPTHFLYSTGRGEPIPIRWENVLFSGPRPDQKPLFPSALVCDGKIFIRFEKFFFPDFEEICEIIQQSRTAAGKKELEI